MDSAEITHNISKGIEANCTSPAVNILLAIIPILGILAAATLFFLFLWGQYRLRKELIKSRQYQPNNFTNLRILTFLIGTLSLSAGLPLTIVFFAIDGLSYASFGGLIPTCVGIGLLVFYRISGVENE